MKQRISPAVLLLTIGVMLAGCQHSEAGPAVNAAVPVISGGAASQRAADETSAKAQPDASGSETTKSTVSIAEAASKSHQLSSQDYALVYHGLKTKQLSSSDALAALSALVAAKNLTPAQKHQVADLCIPMLSTAYPNDPKGDLKPLVITVLGAMGDRRAGPHLMPLLKAPEDTTRLAAQSALNDLGFKTPSTQSLLY